MSTQYVTEPPATATVLLTTTAGPLTLSLFATQTPLTCRNFLQQVLDGAYTNVLFHRIIPNFILQTGDPTGTGEGGTNVYEDGDQSLEHYSDQWAKYLRMPEERYNERIILSDEFHSRLKFNRRGLVGMARMSESKSGQGQYGSQFFITLADCRAELDGKCTMFGRVEGDGIYNIMRIADGERIEGTDRAVYPEKIIKAEVIRMPEGQVWSDMKPRQRIEKRVVESIEHKPKPKAKKKARNLVSFGDDEDVDMTILPKAKKAKFNTALIDSAAILSTNGHSQKSNQTTNGRHRSSSPSAIERIEEPPTKKRKPSFHDSTTQLPLRDTERASRSITPQPTLPQSTTKSASQLESEIAALKSSMKRIDGPTIKKEEPKSILQAMIPTTATRGRKRPKDGTSVANTTSMNLLSAFRSRLEKADSTPDAPTPTSTSNTTQTNTINTETESAIPPVNPHENTNGDNVDQDSEAILCDLHFIANCASCTDWPSLEQDNDDDAGFLGHKLTFERDRLGKDLTWKKKNEEELVVIDPREREKELGVSKHKKKKERPRV